MTDPTQTHVLYCTNLPFTMPEDEIIQFLGLSSDTIKSSLMCKNQRGQPSGDCFIEVTDQAAFESALGRSGTRTSGENSRRVTVSKSTLADMTDPNAAIKNKDKWDGIVKLRGFPGAATIDHVNEFLNGVEYNKSSIVMPRNHNDMAIGEVYVQFYGYNEAQNALARSKQVLESLEPQRYIEVLKSSNNELRKCIVATIKQNAMVRCHKFGGNQKFFENFDRFSRFFFANSFSTKSITSGPCNPAKCPK